MSKATDIADWGQYQPVRKNLIINGGMEVAQRGTTFTAASGFTLDRWEIGSAGAMVIDVSQQTNATAPALTSSYLYYEVTTVDTSIAAADLSLIAQHIEGYNIIPLGWHLTDQASKKDVTVSFWHKHTKTGINCVAIRNASLTRSYVAEYTQTVSDTWEYESFTIPAPTDGTWEVGNASGIQIFFGAVVGSTYQAAKDTWQTGNYLGTSSQVNNCDSTSNKMRFTGIQLEVGDTATEFENRMFAEELALCQRYYQKSYPYGTSPGTAISGGCQSYTAQRTATQEYISPAQFAVLMRATPTLTIYGTDGTLNRINGIDSANLVGGSFALSDRQIRVVTATSAHVLHDRYQFQWEADAEL